MSMNFDISSFQNYIIDNGTDFAHPICYYLETLLSQVKN